MTRQNWKQAPIFHMAFPLRKIDVLKVLVRYVKYVVTPRDVCIKFAFINLIRRTVKGTAELFLFFLFSFLDSSQKLKAAGEMPAELKQRQNPP